MHLTGSIAHYLCRQVISIKFQFSVFEMKFQFHPSVCRTYSDSTYSRYRLDRFINNEVCTFNASVAVTSLSFPKREHLVYTIGACTLGSLRSCDGCGKENVTFKSELCVRSSVLRIFHVGHVIQNRLSALSLAWHEWFSCKGKD